MNEETRTMQTADTTPARAPEDAPALVKKIGKTTYKVRVHFSGHQHRNHERQNQAYA